MALSRLTYLDRQWMRKQRPINEIAMQLELVVGLILKNNDTIGFNM